MPDAAWFYESVKKHVIDQEQLVFAPRREWLWSEKSPFRGEKIPRSMPLWKARAIACQLFNRWIGAAAFMNCMRCELWRRKVAASGATIAASAFVNCKLCRGTGRYAVASHGKSSVYVPWRGKEVADAI